jgi:DNA polymerase-4
MPDNNYSHKNKNSNQERAIVHFDGDSFFASVEQVMDYKLKGKAVITGGERGAITSVSVEGKKLGINRGMTLAMARAICPDLVVVSSDYTSYSLFARRMYSIVREFTDLVEEYSIDECFADITDVKDQYKDKYKDKEFSYPELVLIIKKKLEDSLGVTFGVGLAPNKVLAKLASKHRKPAGFTHIPKEEAHAFLEKVQIGKVWGIGPSSSLHLGKLGIRTALDFANKDKDWIDRNSIAKPYQEIWYELNGVYIKKVINSVSSPDEKIGSIITSRTFTPPSSKRDYVFSQLSKNIESACIKARRHKVKASHVRLYLKTQEFTYKSYDFDLNIALSTPLEIINLASKYFHHIYGYDKNILYRATGVALSGLVHEECLAQDLFGESKNTERSSEIFSVVDDMSRKYGKFSVILGSSLEAMPDSAIKTKHVRDAHETLGLIGERKKKSLNIPFLGMVR